MTLDEMLALLPDNTAGDIDAADLRSIVTALFSRGRESSVWTWRPDASDPAAGEASLNNADPSLATALRVWGHAKNTRDMTALLNSLEVGSSVSGVGWDDSGEQASFTVTGFPSNSGSGWVVIPATFATGSGTNGLAWADVVLSFEA